MVRRFDTHMTRAWLHECGPAGRFMTAVALSHHGCLSSDMRNRVTHPKALYHRAEIVASSVDGMVQHFDVRCANVVHGCGPAWRPLLLYQLTF